MMESCLNRMVEYTTTRQNNYKKLSNLSGMRVKIGRYLGLSSDGSCIIPWDWELPS